MTAANRFETICFPIQDGACLDVREVRCHIRKLFGADHPRIDDIELIASEIATNALVHTDSGKPGGRLRVAVLRSDDRERVEMTDDGGAVSVPHMVTDVLAENGRGLRITRELADDCGSWQDQRGRTTVWFEMVLFAEADYPVAASD